MDEVTFRRTTWRVWGTLGFSVAALGFLAYASRPTIVHDAFGRPVEMGSPVGGVELAILAVVFGAAALGAILLLRTARHRISVNAEGFQDASTGIARRIPWAEIVDLTLSGSERRGFELVVERRGAPALHIGLNGIEGGPQPVM